MSKHKDSTTFLPVLGGNTTKTVEKPAKIAIYHENIFKEFLKKNKYDINFSIGILKNLLSFVEARKFQASTCLFSVQRSCERLLAFLEIERDNPVTADNWVHAACSKCQYIDIVRQSVQNEWQCPYCTRDIDPIMIDFT